MKIAIFGATGGVGKQLVVQALAAGHEVTAFARDPGKLDMRHDGCVIYTTLEPCVMCRGGENE